MTITSKMVITQNHCYQLCVVSCQLCVMSRPPLAPLASWEIYSQDANVISPAYPGSALGPPPGCTSAKYLPRKASKSHLNQISKSPQLALLSEREQQPYSESIPYVEESYFRHLHLHSCSFSHYPQSVTIAKVIEIDQPLSRDTTNK